MTEMLEFLIIKLESAVIRISPMGYVLGIPKNTELILLLLSVW